MKAEHIILTADDDPETLPQMSIHSQPPACPGESRSHTAETSFQNSAGCVQAERALQTSEERYQRQNAILEGINRVLCESFGCETEEEVALACLTVAKDLTGSKVGFISIVNSDGIFDTIALSDPGWGACRIPELDAVMSPKGMEVHGIWDRVIKAGESVIANDPASHPDAVGTPEGHPSLISFLGVPLKCAHRTIGMIALANKESGYDEADRQGVEALSVAFAEALSRKRAEEAVREREKQYRGLFEGIPVGLSRSTPKGRILDANPTLVAMLGYPDRQTLVAQDTASIYRDTKERQRWQALMEHHGEVRGHEARWLRYDGTSIWVRESARGIRDDEGQLLYYEGVIEDITDRVQAEREIEQRAAQLALLNSIGRQIAAELEIDGVLERAVSLVRESFGYHHVAIFTMDDERGELVMKAKAGLYTDLYPPEHRLRLGEGIVGWVGLHGERLLSNDTRTEPQYVNLYPDTMLTLSELSVPIRVGPGIAGVLDVQSPQSSAFDDNDVVVMETLADQIAVAIRNSRLYSQVQQRVSELAFLNSASQIMVSSLDQEKVMETTMRQATEVLQMEAGSLMLLDSDTDELVFAAAWGGGAEGLPSQRLPPGKGVAGWVAQHGEPIVVPDVRKDPRFYPHFDDASHFATRSILCVPLIYRGKVIGVMQALNKLKGEFTVADQRLLEALASTAATAIENARLYRKVGRELEERMRAEEALRKERASLTQRVAERTAELSAANAELASAARLKDEFLASMSHELRTPLNAILGLSEALQEEVYGPLSEGQAKSLSRIEESGRHLLALINDILDVSKIEAGKLELQMHPTPVDVVCQASLRLVRQMAQKKRLKVATTFDSRVSVVKADERRLKQILVNLLTNACKFTPEGGTIGLEVTRDVEAGAVRFTVWDTGIGISKEDLERLFQPFVQLDSSLSRRYEGTGLGLALVRRLTELHGGGVSVESQVGKGSRLTVSLPWREERPKAEQASSQEPAVAFTKTEAPLNCSSGTRALVLLAEDNEENIITVLDYLQSKNYRVIVARNGAEAIARAREECPDIILMDIQMPEMDGLEAIEHIRADEAQAVSTVPIVALTALAMPGDRERCLKAGADVYLSKPVGLCQLADVIQTQLGPN